MLGLERRSVGALFVTALGNFFVTRDPRVSAEHWSDKLDVTRDQSDKIGQPGHCDAKFVKILKCVIENYRASYRWGQEEESDNESFKLPVGNGGTTHVIG